MKLSFSSLEIEPLSPSNSCDKFNNFSISILMTLEPRKVLGSFLFEALAYLLGVIVRVIYINPPSNNKKTKAHLLNNFILCTN